MAAVVLRRRHQRKCSAPRRAGPSSAGTIGPFTSTFTWSNCIATCLPRGKVGQGTSCPQRFSTYRSSLLSPPDTVTQLLFDGSFAERNKVRARDMVCSAISTEVSSCGIRRLLRDLWYARGRHLRNRDVHNLLRNPFEMSFLWSLVRSCHGCFRV